MICVIATKSLVITPTISILCLKQAKVPFEFYAYAGILGVVSVVQDNDTPRWRIYLSKEDSSSLFEADEQQLSDMLTELPDCVLLMEDTHRSALKAGAIDAGINLAIYRYGSPLQTHYTPEELVALLSE